MLPKVVKVGGVNYAVEESEFVEIYGNANALGSCSHDDTMIKIKSTLSQERKKEVLAHEVMHAIFYESGYYEHDEELIDRTAKVLHQVLKDNELFKE